LGCEVNILLLKFESNTNNIKQLEEMIGPSIKRIRQSRNITQQDLAEWLGVSRQAISMWEAGRREIKVTTLHKIANVLGVTMDEVIQMPNRKGGENFMKNKDVKTTFKLKAPDAKSVALTGNFKNWDPKGIKMRKGKDGIWNIGVDLNPGRYEYKFIVDNNWITDPDNKNVVTNAMGSQNSILEVAA
jgi:transcriptional regulator with XRE-family HTH domain